MAGSSPGTTGGPATATLGEISGAHEACPSPCNRGCAHRKCTVMLCKEIGVNINHDQVEKCDYLEVNFYSTGNREKFELSIDNFVRTISKSAEVETVSIWGDSDGQYSVETLKTLCKTLETVSSLHSLTLSNIDSSLVFVSDAEAIFNVLGVHNTLQKCRVTFSDRRPTQAAIVKALVDALLQNRILRDVTLDFPAGGQSSSLSNEGVKESGGILRELGRYMKAPTNVLTELVTRGWSDDKLVQLADLLGDNKQLQTLWLWTMHPPYSEGMIRMGEMLKINTSIENLHICHIPKGDKLEIKSLVEALVPDATSGIQPNTHLNCLSLFRIDIEEVEGMKQLATLLRSNTSLTSLDIDRLPIFQKENEDVDVHVEILFNSLRSNASLEALDLSLNSGIGGKHVLGMIMDMLLHNRTLRSIDLERTRLHEDGDAEVVYAELRTRGPMDQKLEQAIRHLEHVPPNSARVFLCGDPEAGKTTLCNKWKEIVDKQDNLHSTMKKGRNFFQKLVHPNTKKKSKRAIVSKKCAQLSDISERTRGIEVHKLVWEGIQVSLWDMAGQLEFHAFHDLVLPNQSAKGEGCFYFVVCDPTKYIKSWNNTDDKPSPNLEADIEYWLMFLASNTRHSASYHPHVTILMTHLDKWQSQDNVDSRILEIIVSKLKIKFQLVLDFDQDLVFISMDNEKSCNDARMVKERVEQYLKQLSSRLPKVLKASMELQLIVTKWREANGNDYILRWKDFSKDLFAQVEGLKPWKERFDDKCLDKLKKHTTKSLHSGGHIIYFEDIDLVIMNPHWFCNHVIGNILYNCSKLSKACTGVDNGIVSQEDFMDLCKDALGLGLDKDHYANTLEIMKKLQMYYEDRDDRIMIPSLLSDKQDSMDWDKAFYTGAHSFNYVGTKLTSKDNTITLPSEGFFPRLQVYLHDKYDTRSYKIYLNIISFIYNDINVFITRKDGSINIMSQSSSGNGDHAHHGLHKEIIIHINDLRQKPTLGCPGVILEDHSIWPKCVEHPFTRKLQSVSKKHLKETILRTGDLKYTYQWIDEKNCAEAVPATKLLGDEEWHKILESRDRMVKEMDKVLDQQLATSDDTKEGSSSTTSDDGAKANNGDSKESILARLDSIKKLIQCTQKEAMERRNVIFKEVMERLNVMESKIIWSQEALAARVCSNIDQLIKFSLQLKDSHISKLPYIVELDGSKKRCFLFKMIPGLRKCHLQFRCEHNDHGLHTVDDQPGCEIMIGTDITRKLGTVMFWGLAVTTMLLKVGAHVAAPGMGSLVPDLAKGLATILDTPGLLDLAQPKGPILECLPAEFKANRVISVQDNEEAKEWLIKFLETKQQSIYQMFKLTQVKYSSKSSKKEEIGWVCDAHKH